MQIENQMQWCHELSLPFVHFSETSEFNKKDLKEIIQNLKNYIEELEKTDPELAIHVFTHSGVVHIKETNPVSLGEN